MAQKETAGNPNVDYLEVNHHQKQCGVTTNSIGISLPYMVWVSQRVLDSRCTRAVYQELKRAA